MKTYLVTGAAGFIGSNFVHYMLNTYKDVRIVNVDKLTYAGNLENLVEVADNPRHVLAVEDICDADAMERLIAKFNPDYIINFAAESHVDRSIADCSAFIDTNIVGTSVLLSAARNAWEQEEGDFGNHKYCQVSTDEVYGSLSLDEPDVFFTEDTPLCAHSPYSASKASADLLVMAYHDTYGMPVNITRCSNNYGPYQFPEKLIPLIIGNCIKHEMLPVYGDGLNVRDWLYVEDHCRAIDLVARKGVDGEVYNVGGHNERSNIHIVKTIIETLSLETGDEAINEQLISYVTDRKGHDRRYGIDPKKIGDALGWQPETRFEVGIVQTIKWYLANQEWMKRVQSGEYQNFDAKKFNSDF